MMPEHRQPQQRVLNALTVDVEDYFHVAAFEGLLRRAEWGRFEPRVDLGTRLLLDLFAEAGVRGTFFVLGWVAERQPDLVRDIQGSGHEIGCHSHWHRLVYRQTPAEFRADLRRARDVLQQTIGEAVVAYRAPCFSIIRQNLWAIDILIEEGFVLDSSIFPTFHDRYGIAGAPPMPHWIVRPAGTIREFPLTVHRCLGYPLPIGGGGYFRLYPYWVTRRGLNAVNRLGRPAAIYLHPWELDAAQPRMPVGPFTRFRHYVGLGRTRDRLKQLLRDFAFGTVSEAFSQVEAGDSCIGWDLRCGA
jgi:polysaccharide deacetylase family protein (PEP-CTERM system associated)